MLEQSMLFQKSLLLINLLLIYGKMVCANIPPHHNDWVSDNNVLHELLELHHHERSDVVEDHSVAGDHNFAEDYDVVEDHDIVEDHDVEEGHNVEEDRDDCTYAQLEKMICHLIIKFNINCIIFFFRLRKFRFNKYHNQKNHIVN